MKLLMVVGVEGQSVNAEMKAVALSRFWSLPCCFPFSRLNFGRVLVLVLSVGVGAQRPFDPNPYGGAWEGCRSQSFLLYTSCLRGFS